MNFDMIGFMPIKSKEQGE